LAASLAMSRNRGDCPHRDGVIAAEEKGKMSFLENREAKIAYPRRKIEDICLALIGQPRTSRIGRNVRVGAAEVPTVGNLMAEINQRLAQAGHAQRLRSHPAAAHRSA